MSHALIGKRTLVAFREHFVGWILREIDEEFQSAGLLPDETFAAPVGGERRSKVEQYYHPLDLSDPVQARKLLEVFATVLSNLEVQIEAGTTFNEKGAKAELRNLQALLRRDGLRYEEGRVFFADHSVELRTAPGVGTPLDSPELHRQLDRIRSAVDSDPGMAVGQAKELVETTCKTILDQASIPYSSRDDLISLVKAARTHLDLLPSNIPNSAKGADVMRRLLSNLGSVAQGLGELRNLYGTGHGRSAASGGLSPRHARLAVGAATTLAMFLFETNQVRSK
jgi:hypothetical protein